MKPLRVYIRSIQAIRRVTTNARLRSISTFGPPPPLRSQCFVQRRWPPTASSKTPREHRLSQNCIRPRLAATCPLEFLRPYVPPSLNVGTPLSDQQSSLGDWLRNPGSHGRAAHGLRRRCDNPAKSSSARINPVIPPQPSGPLSTRRETSSCQRSERRSPRLTA